MKLTITSLFSGALTALAMTTAAMAQGYYNPDAYCRQVADQQTAGMRAQASGNAVGSALLGAGIGAGIGAAVGGGRGAGIGAASGAILGTGAGAANAANANAYADQQAYAIYQQCMSAYAPRPPAPAYAPAYAPPPPATTNDLNRQEMNQMVRSMSCP